MIKGCDSLTGIIPTLVLVTGANGVLLHSDLETFVLSCIKDEYRRRWAYGRVEAFQKWALPESLRSLNTSRLSLGEMAACLWAMHMIQYARLLDEFPTRLRAIHCESLIDSPERTLSEIIQLLNIAPNDGAESGAPSPFHSHAKTGVPYSPEQRALELAALADIFGGEVRKGREWFDREVGELRLGELVVTSAPRQHLPS